MTDEMKISARDANINALKEEISGLHKYIDKLEQQWFDIRSVIEKATGKTWKEKNS